jgi:exopolyphosphatase/pppGpp-phosphohydrolase
MPKHLRILLIAASILLKPDDRKLFSTVLLLISRTVPLSERERHSLELVSNHFKEVYVGGAAFREKVRESLTNKKISLEERASYLVLSISKMLDNGLQRPPKFKDLV